MVYLLATVANDAEHMPSLLHSLRGMGVDVDGANLTWGLGYFADRRALILRRPSSILPEQTAFAMAPEVRSRTVMACARPEKHQLDAPPYRFRNWLFGYVGDLSSLGALQSQVEGKMPDFIREVLGDAHGGRLAHAMFLTELKRAGMLTDGPVDPEALKTALSTTLDTLERLVPEASPGAALDTAFAVSNGRFLAVTATGRTLYERSLEGLEGRSDGPIDETLHDFKQIAESLRRFRARVIAFHPQRPEGEGWKPIAAYPVVFDCQDLG